MKNLPWIGLGLLGFLVISTQFPPSAEIVEAAGQYFSTEEIQQGRSFALQRRWIFWANAIAQLALLVYLVFTPLGKRLYLATGAIVHGHWLAHLVLLGGAYYFASAAIAFPFRLAGYFISSHWELTTQSLGSWLSDYVTGLLVMGAFEAIVIVGFYAIVRLFPGFWWLVGGAASVVLGFVVALVLPAAIDPLFNTFTPINQTEHKKLEPRIRAMGQRVGASAANIYVADASRQTTASNAYFTGFGNTQRIVLYDNLLNKHSPDEVESVIAHEMAHWWHQHIFQGILIAGAATTAGLFLLFLHLNSLVEVGSLRSAGDVAGLFRVILLVQLALAITMPIQRGISRRMERQADEVALELSGKPQAFIDAEIRLAKFNKMDVTPANWNVLLFGSHPPVVRRIQMAEQWAKDHPPKTPAPALAPPKE
jgi:STE24 endopeptidase